MPSFNDGTELASWLASRVWLWLVVASSTTTTTTTINTTTAAAASYGQLRGLSGQSKELRV